MFDNIGGKIKALAKVVCWIGIIVSCIVGFVMLINSNAVGLLIAGVGSLSSWIGSFVLYGFGQLIENSDRLAAHLCPYEENEMDRRESEEQTKAHKKEEEFKLILKQREEGLISEEEFNERVNELNEE